MSQNLFNYNVPLQPAVMDIRSETLEPISSSTSRYVFRLDQYGQLDSNSVLLFKPLSNDATLNTKLRVNNGLLAIKRASFQVGDYVLNDISDIGRIANLVDMGGVNVANNSKFNSHYNLSNKHYAVLDSVGSDKGINTLSVNGGVGSTIYDNKRSAFDFGNVGGEAGGAGGGVFSTDARPNNCMITNVAANNHQIGIPLGQLFPCLKGQDLPLYLFQDYRILLTIEFHTCEKWVNTTDPAGNSGMACASGVVSPTDVKLQVDYIVMPSEIQNQQREMTNQQGGLNLSFVDIIKIEKQIPAATANVVQQVQHRIGMDNREVHKIYMLKKLERTNRENEDRIYLDGRMDGINQEEYNCEIDGIDIFQEDKWSPSSQYDETVNCLGSVYQIPRIAYFNDENTIMSKTGDSMGGVLGKQKPLCLDLGNGNAGVVGAGRSIGAFPIIWKYKRIPTAEITNAYDDTTAANDGSVVVQTALNGAMNVDYFVYCSRTANIQSTPNGTAVMVSY